MQMHGRHYMSLQTLQDLKTAETAKEPSGEDDVAGRDSNFMEIDNLRHDD